MAELAEAHRRAEVSGFAKAEERLAVVGGAARAPEAVVAELAERRSGGPKHAEELAEAQRWRTEARGRNWPRRNGGPKSRLSKIDSRLNRWEAFLSLTVEDEAADALRVRDGAEGLPRGAPVYWRPRTEI